MQLRFDSEFQLRSQQLTNTHTHTHKHESGRAHLQTLEHKHTANKTKTFVSIRLFFNYPLFYVSFLFRLASIAMMKRVGYLFLFGFSLNHLCKLKRSGLSSFLLLLLFFPLSTWNAHVCMHMYIPSFFQCIQSIVSLCIVWMCQLHLDVMYLPSVLFALLFFKSLTQCT